MNISAPFIRRPVATTLLSAGITTTVEFFKLFHAPALDSFRLTIPVGERF